MVVYFVSIGKESKPYSAQNLKNRLFPPLDIYVNKYINEDINNNPDISTNLTKNEILEIVRDLVTALGFDLDSYNLSVSDVNNYNYNYKVCTFTKKNDPNDKFVIDIYSKNKFITRYRRNPSKEI